MHRFGSFVFGFRTLHFTTAARLGLQARAKKLRFHTSYQRQHKTQFMRTTPAPFLAARVRLSCGEP